MKTAELTGATLDWVVAKCGFVQGTARSLIASEVKPYSTDWAQGGLIIEQEGISIGCHLDGAEWFAKNYWAEYEQSGSTPLIAAMRCYVASKLGDEVEIPEELNV
jgi:hypothetical protein